MGHRQPAAVERGLQETLAEARAVFQAQAPHQLAGAGGFARREYGEQARHRLGYMVGYMIACLVARGRTTDRADQRCRQRIQERVELAIDSK